MSLAKRLFLAALTAVFSLGAFAQGFPTIPSNTVVGRVATTTGPAQAIPFATLASKLTITPVGSTLIGYTPPGTGGVATTVSAEFQLTCLSVDDYGAVGDGTTDDTTALTNWLNAVYASSALCGRMSNKTYAISAALPNIAKSGVAIYGAGPNSYHAVGSPVGSVIKWIGSSGSTMLTVSPVSGASNQRLDGVRLIGLTFNCNDLSDNGVALKSIFNGIFDISVLECTSVGMSTGVVASLGDAADFQYNAIRYTCTNFVAKSGICLTLNGSSTANTSFNWFERIDIGHSDALGIDEINADNNLWGQVRVFQAGGGAATNSIQWRGGASSGVSVRNETFLNLSTTVAAIAKGTGTYTVGAQNIRIQNVDTTNSTPTPTEETGTTIYDDLWRSTTPTITSGSGSITTKTCNLRYQRQLRRMNVGIAIVITTNGTGATNIQVPLPAATANFAGSASSFAGYDTVTGLALSGYVAQNSSTYLFTKYEGSYAGADGKTFIINGSYETP